MNEVIRTVAKQREAFDKLMATPPLFGMLLEPDENVLINPSQDQVRALAKMYGYTTISSRPWQDWSDEEIHSFQRKTKFLPLEVVQDDIDYAEQWLNQVQLFIQPSSISRIQEILSKCFSESTRGEIRSMSCVLCSFPEWAIKSALSVLYGPDAEDVDPYHLQTEVHYVYEHQLFEISRYKQVVVNWKLNKIGAK